MPEHTKKQIRYEKENEFDMHILCWHKKVEFNIILLPEIYNLKIGIFYVDKRARNFNLTQLCQAIITRFRHETVIQVIKNAIIMLKSSKLVLE